MRVYGSVFSRSRRDGVVLIVVMGLLFGLVLLGSTVYSLHSIDTKSLSNYNSGLKALHNAEAGRDYVSARVAMDVDKGTLVLDDAVETINYGVPHNFTFEPVTQLVRLADQKSYTYRVTGFSGPARAAVEVVVGYPVTTLDIGGFGHVGITLKPGVGVYSYHSSMLALPMPLDSTGEAAVGSNEEVIAAPEAVDGTIYLGEDDEGNTAVFANKDKTSAAVEEGEQVDPDPFGVEGGYLQAKFAQVALSNNNDLAMGGIRRGNVLTIKGNVLLTSGNYYVDEINLRAHTSLAIDANTGPVHIYLTGGAYAAPNSSIAVTPFKPTNFKIFSNSSEAIDFQPNAHFVGLIYAPLAEVQMKPNANFYGGLWAANTMVMPGGQFYLDLDLLDDVVIEGDLGILSWKQTEL